jgi:hypothetical protein
MTVTNRQLNRWIRRTLYNLKRQYGSTIEVHQQLEASTNLTTGVKDQKQLITRIQRAIVLPTQLARETNQAISVIAANKAFVYGGTYDIAARTFIIDARDVQSGFAITLDDWIAYDSRQFQLKTISELEQHTGWLIEGRANMQAVPSSLHIEHTDSALTLSSTGAI